MSIEFKLTNQNLISNTRTDNAVKAFEQSVGNGQARLAIEVLVDVINGMVIKLEELEEKINNIQIPVQQPSSKVEQDNRPKVDQDVKPKSTKGSHTDKEINSIAE